MSIHLLLTTVLLWSLAMVSAALSSHTRLEDKPFSCTGGTIYVSAHPTDVLLYQNPALLHDLYVFRCVTTIVMTSGNRGKIGKFSQSLEWGLQDSYTLMANLSVDDPTREERVVRVGTHNLHSWSMRGMRNIQILFLRLPDSMPSGHGYDAYRQESLSRLYKKEVQSVTSTDGNATYTLQNIKELIAFILHERKPNFVHILNHKAKVFGDHEHATSSDHADHVMSATLVQGVVTAEGINTTVKSYAANNVRKFDANISPSHRDFARKSAAFFKYASYDDDMCQSHKQCEDKQMEISSDYDVRYVAQYLGREYNVL